MIKKKPYLFSSLQNWFSVLHNTRDQRKQVKEAESPVWWVVGSVVCWKNYVQNYSSPTSCLALNKSLRTSTSPGIKNEKSKAY